MLTVLITTKEFYCSKRSQTHHWVKWNSRWYEPLRRISESFMRHSYIETSTKQFLSSVFCIHTTCLSHNPARGNLAEWSPLTMLATIANPTVRELPVQVLHHVCADMWGWVLHYAGNIAVITFSYMFKLSWISIYSSIAIKNPSHVHMMFLTGNDFTNHIFKDWSKKLRH